MDYRSIHYGIRIPSYFGYVKPLIQLKKITYFSEKWKNRRNRTGRKKNLFFVA